MPSVIKKAYYTLMRGYFDANCMMVTAAFGALLLEEYDDAASVSFLFSISDFLEARATRKARLALDSIANMQPDFANLIDPITGLVQVIPVDDLKINNLVIVRSGDQIPSDGVVLEGLSQIDESSLTGESLLVTKGVGDAVSGGTINAGNARLIVRTTVLVEDSAVSKLIRLVEESTSNRSPTEQIIDAFARSYTPAVLFIATLMSTIPWYFGVEEGRRWATNSFIIVAIACPCALTISTPITYTAGLAFLAKRGIIVKCGARLEALGDVDTIVFDKTGTLTSGQFQLCHLDVIDSSQKSRLEILALLSVIETSSSHPLSTAFINAAEDEGVDHTCMIAIDHYMLKGEGVTANVNNEEVYVGNEKLFKRLDLFDGLSTEQKDTVRQWGDEGGTVGFVGIKTKGILGMYCVADQVRPEAKSVIATMMSSDCDVFMLTGDSHGAATSIAKKVGISLENIRSQCLPEDKLSFITSMLLDDASTKSGEAKKLQGKLLFVGDGVNGKMLHIHKFRFFMNSLEPHQTMTKFTLLGYRRPFHSSS